MSSTVMQGISLIAMMLSLPLISWGASSEITPLTIAGAVVLVLGMLMLTVIRYIDTKEKT